MKKCSKCGQEIKSKPNWIETESLEDLEKQYRINKLQSEILCWKIHVLKSGFLDDTYINAIERNEKELSKLKRVRK